VLRPRVQKRHIAKAHLRTTRKSRFGLGMQKLSPNILMTSPVAEGTARNATHYSRLPAALGLDEHLACFQWLTDRVTAPGLARCAPSFGFPSVERLGLARRQRAAALIRRRPQALRRQRRCYARCCIRPAGCKAF
jgi:hypothetical protein